MTYDLINVTRPACGMSPEQHRCEDYSLSFEQGGRQILAVADGHGARKCDLAYMGAKFACKSAARELIAFADRIDQVGTEAQFLAHPEKMEKQLASSIVTSWADMCRSDSAATGMVADDSLTRYGTTLIAALKTARWLLILQQGDGRAFVVHADCTTDQPVPWDDRCIGNVTTSMCDEDAAAAMRFALIDLEKDFVYAVYLETDGVEDCFASVEFNGLWLSKFMAKGHTKYVLKDLPEYVAAYFDKLSAQGSRDDISLAAMIDFTGITQKKEMFCAAADALESKIKHEELLKRANEYCARLQYRAKDDYLAVNGLFRKFVWGQTVPRDPVFLKQQIGPIKEHFDKTLELMDELADVYSRLPAGMELPTVAAPEERTVGTATPDNSIAAGDTVIHVKGAVSGGKTKKRKKKKHRRQRRR